MTKDIFFALLSVRLLKLQFVANMSWNDKIVTFRPPLGSNIKASIYITNYNDHVNISVYKISKSCYHHEVTNEFIENMLSYDGHIETIVSEIKNKLKLKYDIKS